MSKDGRRECPDCDGLDFGHISLFGSKGNGRCSDCHGTGKQTDVIIGLAGPILGFDTYEPCDRCNGTGQCQTCGGTGFEYYYDENYNDDYNDSSDQPKTYDTSSYSGYDYSSDFSPPENSPKESAKSSSSGVGIGFVLSIVLIIASVIIYKSLSNNPVTSIPQQQYSQPVITKPIQVAPCKGNGTGDYSFSNKTERTIYIFVSSATWWKTIEVPPHQTVTEFGMVANGFPYDYKYSYFKVSNFDNNDVRGTIIVKECETKTLELLLPPADWYTLTSNQPKEIHIPPGCCYVIVAPYRGFSFHYSDGVEHVVDSYLFLPEGTDEITLSSPYEKPMEISIQKYTPRELTQ